MDADRINTHSPLPRCPACGATYSSDSRFCALDGHALAIAPVPAVAGTFERASTVAVARSTAPTHPRPRRHSGHALLIAGRYLRVRSLGDGGQGDVWLVQDIQTGRMLALKRFRGDMDTARCRAEIEAATRIEDHSHIVKIHELHRDPDSQHFFMTMEYLDGETLEDRLERAPQLSLLEAVAILAQMSRGLSELHDKRLVHRDIKPANVMLLGAPDGTQVKLLDLGIAKSLRPESKQLTLPGWVVGTLDYAAPEQLRGEPVTPAFDMYALGVVAHLLLEGRLPNASSDAVENVEPRPIPGALRDLVVRMLSEDPADRPGDMREVEQALTHARHWLEANRHRREASPRQVVARQVSQVVLREHPPVVRHNAEREERIRIPKRWVLPRLVAAATAVAAAVVFLFAPALEGARETRMATAPSHETFRFDGAELRFAELALPPDVCTPGIRGADAAC